MTVRGRWLDSISNPIVVLYYANLNATGVSKQDPCINCLVVYTETPDVSLHKVHE